MFEDNEIDIEYSFLQAGEQLHIDKGYQLSTLEKATEFAKKRCWCHTCNPMDYTKPESVYMRLCPECGNKRCPRATDHTLECTNSNEPGQQGSIY